MKRHLTVALILIATCTFAQSTRTPATQKKLDSLYHVVNTAKSDTVKCLTYFKIANFYANKPDSALLMLITGVRLAQVKNFPKGTAMGKGSMGYYFMRTGNYPAALKNVFEATVIFNDLKNLRLLISCYMITASIYDDLKQEQKAIDYCNLAMQIAEKNHYDENLLNIYSNLVSYYSNLKLYDKALKYGHLEQELAQQKHMDGNNLLANIYTDLGTIYMGLEQYDLGLLYLRKGAALTAKNNNNSLGYYIYSPMTTYFEKIGLLDSARSYGEKALNSALAYHYDALTLTATETLARLNKNYDNGKSIELYQQAININKRIFDTEKTREAENLTINEQQRQQDLITERQKADEEHKDNLQLAGIALFIPLFLIIVLALSRTKVSHKVIEFMSVLGLLLLFEFITLLIHPLAEKVTHHTPVLVYCILVVLAAGLVPLHHTLTHWLTQKLALVHNRHLREK